MSAYTSNLNYIFNKKYFSKSLGNSKGERYEAMKNIKECNEHILNYKYKSEVGLINSIKSILREEKTYFSLKTTYPGLMIGTGYFHEAEKENDEAIKTGFSFDYVTGEPYIPGSTVKGVLRFPFKECPEYIMEILQERLQAREQNIDIETDFIKKLEIDIFGPENREKVVSVGKDIFLDSCIERATQKVLELEYITPHKGPDKTGSKNISSEELDGLVNPIPLRFLKILPDVVFRFSFILEETVIDDIKITKEDKLSLFKQILKDLGIGAKTNVGFGALIEKNE